MIITKPDSAQKFGFFSNYIDKVSTNDLIAGLIENEKIGIIDKKQQEFNSKK